MPRYRITIEYDGTDFVGWQQQAEGLSVQGALQEAVFRFCGERVAVKGSGRTDAGVHALGQVAHFDLTAARDPFRIQEALNFHLKPHAVAVLACMDAGAAFDARFSARHRHYLYRILCRRARPVLERDRVWWLAAPLDAGAMAQAAGVLVGRHDFTTFRAAQCQAKSPVKTLSRVAVAAQPPFVRFDFTANAFLHHMVRNIVGSLVYVGAGRQPPDWIASLLAARDRTLAAPTFSADGLYLAGADYDARFGLPPTVRDVTVAPP